MKRATQKRFLKELARLKGANSTFEMDNILGLWFLKAYVFDLEQSGVEDFITGEGGDGGFDAIAINDETEVVHLVQVKLRKSIGKVEGYGEVEDFILASKRAFNSDRRVREAVIHDVTPHTQDLLQRAYSKIRRGRYELKLHFVTTGNISRRLRGRAQRQLRRELRGALIEVICSPEIGRIFEDYEQGIAPPMPVVSLDIADTGAQIINPEGKRGKRKCWILPVTAASLARVFKQSSVRIFARNVRGYLGPTVKVNDAMRETLEDHPTDFYYFNNGITVVCSDAESTFGNRKALELRDAQIVNGQQTVRTIATFGANSGAAVLAKIIVVPSANKEYDDFVSNTVRATNWQNAIKYADLCSNDPLQLDVEVKLRERRYQYVRKRQRKGEARRRIGLSKSQINKEDLAQAVAACLLDPHIVRSGVDKLFADKDTYDDIFSRRHNADFYIASWRLKQLATKIARRRPGRGYAKWLVLNFVWRELSKVLTTSMHRRAFADEIGRRGPLTNATAQAFNIVYGAAGKYYRRRNASRDRQLDISRFYRDIREHHLAFRKFWAQPGNSRRASLLKSMRRIRHYVATTYSS